MSVRGHKQFRDKKYLWKGKSFTNVQVNFPVITAESGVNDIWRARLGYFLAKCITT